MAGPRKVIITCAVTGSGHTPTMSPHLPYRIDDVVEQAVDAADAGAAVLHLHARDPEDGRPSSETEIFLEYASRISARTDAVISLSTGGGTGMSMQQRLDAVRRLRPELCSLNLGTMNFGGFPMIDKYAGSWRFDWEEPYLESTRHEPFLSTYADIEHMLAGLGPETGTRFECEAYDVSHLYTLAHFLHRETVRPPVLVQTIFGIMGGIGTDVDHIVHMKRTADRLLGDTWEWSALGAGRHQFGIVTAAAVMGAHVRVGLEDNLYLERGRLAASNAEQVTRMRTILDALSLEVASADEAREILALKGASEVAF